jgi:hypothetical protein
MLDFGPFGYGISEGMRKEQDRITQNRSTFSNNMANFIAQNPYLSPEAVQAYVNAAAGTDNTLRGVIPNSLVGEFNQENTRRRRIDNFKAFNEFTRLNPGATAAEFQSAMSALGAQGVYGEDALKAIQGRADQYRKDEETKRMFNQAQNIGQLRTQLTTDAKAIFLRNGFDVDKTRKELEQIYGTSTPVPLDTVVNPGMATMIQGDLMREYLPKAVDILGKNPNMTPEMLYGIFPELQGSPVVKQIYDGAQQEREKGVQDKFYGSKKQVVDAVASSILLGTDPTRALEESARGLGIRPDDFALLDSNSILAEARALADKSKADEQKKLDGVLAGAKGKMFESIRTNTLADPVTLQNLANGDVGQVEAFVRARIRDESGLTEEELARIPGSYYQSLAQSIRSQLVTKSQMEQAKTYDDVRGQAPGVLKALREQNTEIAKQYNEANIQAAIKNAGVDGTVSGAVIPTLMATYAETYDLSNGGAAVLFNSLLAEAKASPDAGMNIGAAAIKSAGLKPLASTVSEQVEDMAWKSGAVSRTPLPATTFVSNEKAKLSKVVETRIAEVGQLTSQNGKTPEEQVERLKRFRDQVMASVEQTRNHYGSALTTAQRWSDYNDRFTADHLEAIVQHSEAETQRLLSAINKAITTSEALAQKQKEQTMAPGRILERAPDRSRSGLYNTLAGLKPTEAQQQADIIAGELSRYELGGSPLGYLYKSVEDRELYREIADLSKSPEAVTFLLQNPDLYALIDSRSPDVDPARFIEEFKRFYRPPNP